MPDGQALYESLPVNAQHVAASAAGMRIAASRYGRGFRRALNLAESRKDWPQQAIEEFRDRRLQRTVAHAFTTVPHYRDLARRLGISARDIRGLADLDALPILVKAEVQAEPARFVSSVIPRRQMRSVHTSGTTGAGLRFSSTVAAEQEQWAIWWRYRRMHGIGVGTWCGYFGGRLVVPAEWKDPPYWRYNWPGRQILFSGYHLGPRTIEAYIGELRRRRPPWLHGYPSLISLVAAHLLDSGDDLGYDVTWVSTGAESLLPGQAKLIRNAFGVAPMENYGMAEAVGNASSCGSGRLHLDEDFAAMELLDGPESSLRLVGTNLSNPATPLLRYDTGDLASGLAETCQCGRPGRVVTSIDGRREDHLVLRDGTRVGRIDHVFKDLVNVQEAQVYQRIPGEIEVRLVRGCRYSTSDEDACLAEFRRRLGPETSVRIDYRERLERAASGKFRLVVSELPSGESGYSMNAQRPL